MRLASKKVNMNSPLWVCVVDSAKAKGMACAKTGMEACRSEPGMFGWK